MGIMAVVLEAHLTEYLQIRNDPAQEVRVNGLLFGC